MSAVTPKIISWPLSGPDEQGRYPYAQDNESIREVIWNILMTRPGERLMRPEFGAGLKNYIHQPNNQSTRSLMKDAIRKSIERWEPRIELEGIEVLPDSARRTMVNITIRYRMRYGVETGAISMDLDLSV